MHNFRCINYYSAKDIEYKFEIYEADDFSKLSNVKQVYTVILNSNKNKILIVKGSHGWILPGGGVEEGETLLETAIREIKEETNCTIKLKSLKPFYYQFVYKRKLGSKKWVFDATQVRFLAEINEENQFVCDPDGDVSEVKWIDFNDIEKFIKWKYVSCWMQKVLLDGTKS